MNCRTTLRTAATSMVVALAAALPPSPGVLHAQRVDENPVTDARDAFGTSIGGETIGLYQAGNVRGFSPLTAGNIRLEGLYLDRQGEFTGRLVAGHDIRVGVSALGIPFPAPTGIVDYRLRRPPYERGASVVAQATSFGGNQIEADIRVPIVAGRASIGGGAGLYGNAYPDGGDAFVTSAALIAHVEPADSVELLPFWSRIDVRDRTVSPAILVSGSELPPVIPRRRFFGQRWARLDAVRTNYGLIGADTRGAWTLRSGLFRSTEAPTRSHSVLYLDTGADGAADLSVVANPAQRFASTSGELRLSHQRAKGARVDVVHFSLRGRDVQRRYGGSNRVALGRAAVGEHTRLPAPAFSFGPQSRDHVTQWTAGLAYDLRWTGVGEINAGVQKVAYRKTVTLPLDVLPRSRDDSWLHNVAFALHLRRDLALYGGYARGLEESPIAPETAANRDEAPPAIRTEQLDAGLRWQTSRSVRVVAGVFRIDKPYHAMDTARVFSRLGEMRQHGIEVSVAGELLPGLHIVAGATPLDAKVQSAALQPGGVGARPVGSTRSSVVATLDYRPPAFAAVSVDVGIERTGERVANRQNTLHVPAATTIDVGTRYRFAVRGSSGSLRIAASNVLDTFVWQVSGSGTFSYNAPRQLYARLALDF